MAQLYGSCACERNQYTVIIPSNLQPHAQVFFDNSSTSRRAQATPLTAWLRIPLDWYHSTTYALFPDESHSTIKRTFHTPSSTHATRISSPVRRQFCGYCGTHLTAWSEEALGAADRLDVTLGSLLGESLETLEGLGVIPDFRDDDDGGGDGAGYDYGEEAARHLGEEEDEYKDEMVKNATVDDEVHIPTNENEMGGLQGPGANAATNTAAPAPYQQMARRQMQNRGMPYFEEMVENSRLGRIKRQKGGHTSHDGRTTVQWEVVEIDNSDPLPVEPAPGVVDEERSKRRKTGS